MSASAIDPDNSAIEHVHFGAGTFGLGMVVEICHGEAGLKTAVINRDSGRGYHKILRSKGSYSVLLDSDPNVQKHLSPKFLYHTPANEESVVRLLADPSVALVTTSVRKENLATIAPLLARGLTQRAAAPDSQKLCVMACENLVENSALLKKCVESHLPRDQAQHLLTGVFFCNTLVDRICAPISVGTGSVQIPIESFRLWIVQAPDVSLGVLDLLRGKGLIKLASGEGEFRAHETQKYWCVNGVHLATAAYAYNYRNNLKHFSQALANPHIAAKIKALQRELLLAFSIYIEDMGVQDLFPRKTNERYNVELFQRLLRNRTDTIARVLKLEAGKEAIVELLDRIERLLDPQCRILAKRKKLVSPKNEMIALHPTRGGEERLELDDAIQQVLIALRSFSRDYAMSG